MTQFFFQMGRLQPKPLTFLAGKVLAASVGTAAIDFLLLFIAVPQFLQYVVCHLQPTQMMRLVSRIHSHSDSVLRRFWNVLPSYHHIASSKHISTVHWLWPGSFDFRRDPPIVSTTSIHIDSNNENQFIMPFNMYQTLLIWSSYLNFHYGLVFTPLTSLVELPGASEKPAQLLMIAHARTYEIDQEDSTTDEEEKEEESPRLINFIESYQMANPSGVVYTVHLHKHSIKQAIIKMIRNFNKLMAFFPNEYCQHVFWTNIGKYDNTSMESFDAFRLRRMLEAVFVLEAIHQEGNRDLEKLQAIIRYCLSGLFNVWSSFNHIESHYCYAKVLLKLRQSVDHLDVSTHDGYNRTNMDWFISKCCQYSFYAIPSMISVPCMRLEQQSFFDSAVETSLKQFCISHRLLTAAGIPDSSKKIQFQRFVNNTSSYKYEYDMFDCCTKDMHHAVNDTSPRFASDQMLCALLAAINLNLLGRHHFGLLYSVDAVSQLQSLLVKSGKHPFKQIACYTWSVLCNSLNGCFGAIEQAWECATLFATVSDVHHLVHTIQNMCLVRGCHQLEHDWMTNVYIPNMLIQKSPSAFVTIMLHLENLFFQLENTLVLLLSKVIFKDLVNIAHCGTCTSIEKEIWILEQHIRSIILNYLFPLYQANRQNPQYEHFYLFYSTKINIYCYSTVSSMGIPLAEHNVIFAQTQENKKKVDTLFNLLDDEISSKLRVLVNIYIDYIEYPNFFFSDEETFKKYLIKLKNRNRLEYSLEAGNMYFTLGFLHLLSLYNNRVSIFDTNAATQGFFGTALQHYQHATCNTTQDALHRLPLTCKLADMEKAIQQKIAPVLQQRDHIDIVIPEDQEPTVITFKDILCPTAANKSFLQHCFSFIETLVQEQNESHTMYNWETHSKTMTHCQSTLTTIKKSKPMMAACFDLQYNH